MLLLKAGSQESVMLVDRTHIYVNELNAYVGIQVAAQILTTALKE